MIDQCLPYDESAEQATLGAVLLDAEVMQELSTLVEPVDFYLDKHRSIWEVYTALVQQRIPPDLTTVKAELNRRGQLEQVGGVPYLIDLSNALATAYRADHYARIVSKTAFFRRLMTAGGRIAALAQAQPGDPDQVLADAQALLMGAAHASQQNGLTHIRDVSQEYLRELEEELAGNHPVALKTGWYNLDRLIGGLRRKNLIVLTSPSGIGKSTALCQLLHQCTNQGGRAGVFSLEMGKTELFRRMMVQHLFWTRKELEITYDMIRDSIFTTPAERYLVHSGRFDRADLRALEDRRIAAVVAASSDYFPDLNLYIDDAGELTIDQMRLRAMRESATGGRFDLIGVDYAQLVKATKRHGNREQAVAEVADGLMAMAKDLDCPILALAQQNKQGDVRESDRMFNNCHVEMRLFRDEVKNPDTKRAGLADLVVTKARSGQTDRVPLLWDGAHQLLLNLAEHTEPSGY